MFKDNQTKQDKFDELDEYLENPGNQRDIKITMEVLDVQTEMISLANKVLAMNLATDSIKDKLDNTDWQGGKKPNP